MNNRDVDQIRFDLNQVESNMMLASSLNDEAMALVLVRKHLKLRVELMQVLHGRPAASISVMPDPGAKA